MKKYILIGFVVLFGLIGGLVFYYHKSRPTVSVVMSTYNRADMLPEAIDSILNQTFTDFEFIIINDGSKDDTATVLANYAAQDKRIKIITNNPNQGLITSLNKGLDAARGKYIARLDDDDAAFPQRLEHQVAYLDKNPDITVVGSWISPMNSDRPYSFQRETDPERVKIMLYLGSVSISHPALLMRRDFLNKHNIRYRLGYEAAEDRPFYGDIILAGGKITNLPLVLTHYRLHSSNNPEYYQKQNRNKRRFHVNFINSLFPFDVSEPFRKCDLLPRMIEANKTKKLMNQTTLEKISEELCGGKDAVKIRVIHHLWSDTVIVDGDRIRRYAGDTGKVVHQTDNEITVKWDRFATETFQKREDGSYYLKEDR